MDKQLNDELEALKKELIELKSKLPKNEDAIRLQLDQVGTRSDELGKYNEALSCYKECLEIERKILPSNHSDIARTLNNIGLVYDNQKEYEEALKYYNQSLEIYKKTLSSNDPSIAMILNNIGGVYSNQKEYEDALNYFNQSLEIKKQNFSSDDSSIANTLNNIGLVYDNQKNYEEALKYYNQSLEIYKQTLSSNDPSIAMILNNIGEVYQHQGKFEEALKYYNQSMEISKQTLPSNHSIITTTLNNIGTLYKKQEKYEDALKFLTDEKLKEECRQKLKEQQQRKNLKGNSEIDNKENKIGSSKNLKKEDEIEENIRRNISQLSLSSSIDKDIEDPYIDKIFKERYKVREKLGSGSFGFVYRVNDISLKEDKIKDRSLAMKIMNKCDVETENELKIFWEINHENIVKYIDHFHVKIGPDEKTCLLTEYCEKRDLKYHIDEAKKGRLTFNEREILKWMCQATNALKYLHSMEPKPIIHRDIKPANMLLNKTMQIKIADLGVSKIIDMDRTSASTHAGTIPYMSPEVFLAQTHDVRYYPNTDVWSLGCVLYELIFLKYAFPRGQRGNPDIPSDVSSCGIFSSILPKMLEKDLLKRIKSKKLLKEFINLDEEDD